MSPIEKVVHVFKVKQHDSIFLANCSSLLNDNILQGDSREQIETNIQYFVKNICIREHLQLIYVIEDI